ncbi:hypothetical protein QR680_000704 [Steinernema hermaphroditum]|uniref:Uncharacterized protein n=1 Tax=Steinernema hermaphroditum TaxID=289476 RepID=A0AA39GVQ1_9BILA|nr:hypothetical protein QR680_000704 [Steinernema hermaphroditum]
MDKVLGLSSVRPFTQDGNEFFKFALRIVTIDKGYKEDPNKPLSFRCFDANRITVDVKAFGKDNIEKVQSLQVGDVVLFQWLSIQSESKGTNEKQQVTLLFESGSSATKLHPNEKLSNVQRRFGYASQKYLFVFRRIKDKKPEKVTLVCSGLDGEVKIYARPDFYEHLLKTLQAMSDGSIIEFSGLTFAPRGERVLAQLRAKHGAIATFGKNWLYLYAPQNLKNNITATWS